MQKIIFIAVILFIAAVADAQAVFGNSMAYAPTIDTVSSGVLLDAQGTVSADRKYVTLTMRPQQSQLIDMFTFTFGGNTTQPSGVVGTGNSPPTGNGINPPVAIGPGVGRVLTQRGMTQIK